jgi:hypothetical protein
MRCTSRVYVAVPEQLVYSRDAHGVSVRVDAYTKTLRLITRAL